MNSLKDQKKALRQKVLAERMQISEEEWRLKSDKIGKLLLESTFYKNARFIHSFISMNHRKEVDTQSLIPKMLADGKKIVTSITDFKKKVLAHSQISSVDDLIVNQWGVPEPSKIIEADLELLDVILVPMAAADKTGNRLGYGKGFYDRFLARTKALKVGLIFDKFIFDEIPAQSFDIKMDILISDAVIISVKQ